MRTGSEPHPQAAPAQASASAHTNKDRACSTACRQTHQLVETLSHSALIEEAPHGQPPCNMTWAHKVSTYKCTYVCQPPQGGMRRLLDTTPSNANLPRLITVWFYFSKRFPPTHPLLPGRQLPVKREATRNGNGCLRATQYYGSASTAQHSTTRRSTAQRSSHVPATPASPSPKSPPELDGPMMRQQHVTRC